MFEVFQPRATAISQTLIRDNPTLHAGLIDNLTSGMDITHVEFLMCDNSNLSYPGRPVGISSVCGGTITYSEIGPARSMELFDERGCLGLISCCGNSSCGLEMGVRFHRGEFYRLILHLALKQMVPELPMCNFVNCNEISKHDARIGDQGNAAARVHDLGLIAVVDHCAVNGMYKTPYPRYGIGFIATTGMNTINGCDGYDRWLRALICANHKATASVISQTKSALLGPKPAL